MPKLIMNSAFNVQFEGEFHTNGHPITVAKVTDNGSSARFAENVEILQGMVDLWNAKYGTE